MTEQDIRDILKEFYPAVYFMGKDRTQSMMDIYNKKLDRYAKTLHKKLEAEIVRQNKIVAKFYQEKLKGQYNGGSVTPRNYKGGRNEQNLS